jgi:hypothetical protein
VVCVAVVLGAEEASVESTRREARALLAWLFTVPTVIPSRSAVS